jgi:transcription initiation factor TFIIIB Brf1 subunit/transcription initiation factor TFIIB
MLAKFHRDTLHSYEKRLSAVGGEIRRIRECAGLPQRVTEETEALVKRYFDTVAGFPPEVVAVLWTVARVAGVPRPLEDFLRCSKADERRVRRVAWRLKKAVRLGKRPSVEDYVKALAARVNLPASIAKSAVEILERNRRLLVGKNPWVWAATLCMASFKKLGLLKRLAEEAGSTPTSNRNAANKMRV